VQISGTGLSSWASTQALLARQLTASAGSNTGLGGGTSAATTRATGVDQTSADGGLYGFTAAERARIRAATGAEVGPDGMIDFTTGAAAGRNTGRIPEDNTVAGITLGYAGCIVFYGAVGPGEEAVVPSQHADLPRGTLTGMQIQFGKDATAEQRKTLMDFALGYVHDLNTGANKNWSPGAIFPLQSEAEVAAQRSSTQWGSSVLDRSL
jgi:hypothetical protein